MVEGGGKTSSLGFLALFPALTAHGAAGDPGANPPWKGYIRMPVCIYRVAQGTRCGDSGAGGQGLLVSS